MHDNQHPAMVVAILRRQSDEARLVADGTYHLPLAHAAKVIGATSIAWYVPGWHRETPHTVRYRATILAGSVLTRAAYLPDAADHPRAGALYWVIHVADLVVLDPPLPSARWRRVGVHRVRQVAWERSSDLGEVSRLSRRLASTTTPWEW
ncbi:MAG: hypothetical protein RLZZ297_1050 [Chloroflexota bacterium]